MRVTMKGIRAMVILGAVAVFAVLGGVQYALADGGIEPPPIFANERVSGPGIVGTATLDGSKLTFVGNCKGAPVQKVIDPYVVDLTTLTKESITGDRFNQAGPVGCLSPLGGEDLFVSTVMKFTNTPGLVTADVILLYILVK